MGQVIGFSPFNVLQVVGIRSGIVSAIKATPGAGEAVDREHVGLADGAGHLTTSDVLSCNCAPGTVVPALMASFILARSGQCSTFVTTNFSGNSAAW